jgi:dolichyl-phosphate-mannose--protein O-mannosyl transferase
MIPMMFISRVMYLYHYLPPLIIGIILFGIVLWMAQSLSTNLKRDVLVVSMILLVFMFWVYKPLTYYEPLTREQFQQRNIFPAWDLRCVGC